MTEDSNERLSPSYLAGVRNFYSGEPTTWRGSLDGATFTAAVALVGVAIFFGLRTIRRNWAIEGLAN